MDLSKQLIMKHGQEVMKRVIEMTLTGDFWTQSRLEQGKILRITMSADI